MRLKSGNLVDSFWPGMTAHRLYLILITPTASSDSNSTFVTS
jgi:hypothetical protein